MSTILQENAKPSVQAQETPRRSPADPDVVLCVAGRIVRIAAGIIRAAVRLSRGIDRLIGVTARKRERRDREDDAEPHGRFPTQWSRPAGRSFSGFVAVQLRRLALPSDAHAHTLRFAASRTDEGGEVLKNKLDSKRFFSVRSLPRLKKQFFTPVRLSLSLSLD